MVRTRYAPSPTGYMHCGNLRTAIYEYLIAKSQGGAFVLRIEDTDQSRQVEGAVQIIYDTLKAVGIQHDEGPDVGGDFGPYIQSQRKNDYMKYAKMLVEKGAAYYCFCTKERLDAMRSEQGEGMKYDRHCMRLNNEEIQAKLDAGEPFVIRQLIPEGETSFTDEVYGTITVKNSEIEDQILVKSDGLPTYNFANVVDDYLMQITHVVRGSEYLSSTPKYNILYQAFGWPIPVYVHLPLVQNEEGEKLSKRHGAITFNDMLAMGFLPEAVLNYTALLGWSPPENREILSLQEMTECFNISGLSKSPSRFDLTKLTWMNGEYFKLMDDTKFYEMASPVVAEFTGKTGEALNELVKAVKTRINFIKDIAELVDFVTEIPDYDIALYAHKKMKTDSENSLTSLKAALPAFEAVTTWDRDNLDAIIQNIITTLGVKTGQVFWPLRVALSGKAATPCGVHELLIILGKDESLRRLKIGIEKLGGC